MRRIALTWWLSLWLSRPNMLEIREVKQDWSLFGDGFTWRRVWQREKELERCYVSSSSSKWEMKGTALCFCLWPHNRALLLQFLSRWNKKCNEKEVCCEREMKPSWLKTRGLKLPWTETPEDILFQSVSLSLKICCHWLSVEDDRKSWSSELIKTKMWHF